jgi:hypothetical protein
MVLNLRFHHPQQPSVSKQASKQPPSEKLSLSLSLFNISLFCSFLSLHRQCKSRCFTVWLSHGLVRMSSLQISEIPSCLGNFETHHNKAYSSRQLSLRGRNSVRIKRRTLGFNFLRKGVMMAVVLVAEEQ